MAPFEEMSATEKEEFVISLAVLICADAKVEITVGHWIWLLGCRRKTLISSWRNLATRSLLTGLLSLPLTVVVRISSTSLLLLVRKNESEWCIGAAAVAAPAAGAAAAEAAPAAAEEEEEEEEEEVDMSGGGLFGDDDDDW